MCSFVIACVQLQAEWQKNWIFESMITGSPWTNRPNLFYFEHDLSFFRPDLSYSNPIILSYFSNLSYPIFKASALWANAFYKSKCPYVCLCVCVCVCSLLRYRLNVFFSPTSRNRMSRMSRIRNPWGKVMERNGLRFEHLCLEVV